MPKTYPINVGFYVMRGLDSSLSCYNGGYRLFSAILIYSQQSMKPFKREWMLNAAFILYWVFNLSQQAFMLGTEVSLQKRMQIYTFHNLGMVLGAFLLPLLLPLGYLRGKSNHRFAILLSDHLPGKWSGRLVLVGAIFLPNIIVRLLGPQAWLVSSFNSAFMAIGNGAVATLLLGCFLTLSGNKRALWYALGYSMGYILYNLAVGAPGRELLLPLMFPAAGVFLTCSCVLLLVFLAGIEPSLQEELSEKNILPRSFTEEKMIFLSKTPCNSKLSAGQHASVVNSYEEAGGKRFDFRFIFPILAALVIFWTNSLTNRLFFPTLNIHFPPGFHPTMVVMILALPVLGFLASRWQRQFRIVFVSVSSFFFLLLPSLLFFNRSAPLFLVLYTLNLIIVQMMTQIFPIVIVGLYWQKNPNGRGYWVWWLAIAIFMIRSLSFSMTGPFRQLSLDNAHTVVLLSLAAVAYYFLARMSIGDIKAAESAAAPVAESVAIPAKSMEESFKEHGLSEREAEVALLMAQEGLSTKEMGERLFISPLTVRDHITSIYRKFSVKGRAEFMAVVMRMSRPVNK